MKIPIPQGEVGKEIVKKYFPLEDWEKEYSLHTGILKRVSEYAGMSFKETLQLPYSYFLLLNRESWIYSYDHSEEGRAILKDLWRLQQIGADIEKVRKFEERRGQ